MCIYTVKKQLKKKITQGGCATQKYFKILIIMVIKRGSNGKRYFILLVYNMTCLNLC